jgi:hypothetical protein
LAVEEVLFGILVARKKTKIIQFLTMKLRL